jgi:hypothetical protein
MLYLNLDLSKIAQIGDDLKDAADKAMKEAVRRLTTATHAHILEEAEQRLKSTRQKYVDALKFEQVNEETWFVSLDPSAFFIEEGMPSHEMIDDLLKQGRPKPGGGSGPKGSIKTAKDGSRYRVIPFEHSKGPSQQTPMQTSLTNMVKGEMKSRGIPYGKVEKNAAGQPKTGLLHSFDVVKRGGAAPPTSKAGISLLQGVRVYQTKVKDKQGKETVKRGVFTFRIVSSKHKGSGRWVHPGIEARHFMDKAFDWAVKEWESKIGPETAAAVVQGI